MFTKPQSGVRIITRGFRGSNYVGKSKSITVYGTTVAEIMTAIGKILESAGRSGGQAKGSPSRRARKEQIQPCDSGGPLAG